MQKLPNNFHKFCLFKWIVHTTDGRLEGHVGADRPTAEKQDDGRGGGPDQHRGLHKVSDIFLTTLTCTDHETSSAFTLMHLEE